MEQPPPAEMKEFTIAALETIKSLKPAIEGVKSELVRQQRHASDHEYFMIAEFRNLTRAIEQLTAQLIRMK